MKFKAKKTYGQYKTRTCPFCSRMATQTNEAGVDVCYQHRTQKMEEIKCTCGSWLEQKNGKFGAYFNCINCGNFNYEKAMEIKALTKGKVVVEKRIENLVEKRAENLVEKRIENPKPLSYTELDSIKSYLHQPTSKPKPHSFERRPKETTISSNDVEYFD